MCPISGKRYESCGAFRFFRAVVELPEALEDKGGILASGPAKALSRRGQMRGKGLTTDYDSSRIC